MAARLSPKHDDRSRAKIQTSQLCNRLNNYALGLPDPATGRQFEMSDGQIRAALGLLRKTLPDLAVTQIAGEGGGALVVDFRWADAPPTINGDALTTDVVSHETTDEPPAITFISDC